MLLSHFVGESNDLHIRDYANFCNKINEIMISINFHYFKESMIRIKEYKKKNIFL